MNKQDIPVKLVKSLPIKQQIFSTEENVGLIEIAGSEYEEQIRNYPYHQLIYINMDKPIPITLLSGHKPFNRNRPSFRDCLLKLSSVNYEYLLFLTSLYPIIDPARLMVIIQFVESRPVVPVIDQWLESSFGFLVYAHQLEQLYCMLTGCNYMEAITFRKDWNLKRPKSREIADCLHISPKLYLSNLMKQNSIEDNQFVYSANYAGAFKLWQHLYQLKGNHEHAAT
ncbi:MAG: hypothetical protein WCP61_09865 [Chitinophagia bacterium]